MFDFFGFFKRNNATGKYAAQRLKAVIFHDRVCVTPQYLNLLKTDVMRVIEEYMVTDVENISMELLRRENNNSIQSVLEVKVPIVKVKEIGRNAVI